MWLADPAKLLNSLNVPEAIAIDLLLTKDREKLATMLKDYRTANVKKYGYSCRTMKVYEKAYFETDFCTEYLGRQKLLQDS